MHQVHKVTPWLINKQPGISLTWETGSWLDTGRAEEVWFIQVAHQSDSFVTATLNFHRHELNCDKNRRFSRARRSSWMFWCVTTGDARARSLTRLASTQSETIAQKAGSKLFQVLSSTAMWHVIAPQWEESEYIVRAGNTSVDKGRNYHPLSLQLKCFRSDGEMWHQQLFTPTASTFILLLRLFLIKVFFFTILDHTGNIGTLYS